MNARIAKKHFERFLLDQFLVKLGAIPARIEAREAPDFLVEISGTCIGVELTDLHIRQQENGSPLRVQESIADQIIGKAQQRYLASSGKPAHVTVCLAPATDLKRINRDAVAEALSRFVERLGLDVWQSVDWRPEDSEEPLLPSCISFVHALGVPSPEMGHWTATRAGWAASLTVEAIQSRIDKKSKKLMTYQTVVHENWLVLVADGTRPSQLFTKPEAFDPLEIHSPFSRTYFYGYPEGDLIRLGVQL